MKMSRRVICPQYVSLRNSDKKRVCPKGTMLARFTKAISTPSSHDIDVQLVEAAAEDDLDVVTSLLNKEQM